MAGSHAVLTFLFACQIFGTSVSSRIRLHTPTADKTTLDDPSLWCVALSGNGGNWASTLGFISEALILYVTEKSPEKINLRCAVGGSSGAATTVLLRSLLANPHFGVSPDGVATSAQAVAIARALSLLAQTADLDTLEKVQTFAAVAKTKVTRWGKNAWAKNVAAIDVPSTLLQFGRTIALARHMHIDWSELPVAGMIHDHCAFTPFGIGAKEWCRRDSLVKVAEGFGLQHAADLPRRVTDNQTQERVNQTKEQLTFIMKDISSHLQDLTKSELVKKGFSFGQTNGLIVETSGNMVDDVLAESPEEGFMTVTFVIPRSDLEPSVSGVHYDDVRILALMSQSTAQSILQSASYRRRVSACLQKNAAECQHADRYIIAVVKTMRPMIALPTMEPGIVKPFVAQLSSMGVTDIFDPTVASMQGSWSLKPTSEVDPIELILGGFVDRGQSVVLQHFYAEGKKHANAQFTLFGKNADPKTALDAVVDLLSDENSGDANWADYKAWAQARPAGTFIDGQLDWDCGAGLPANIRGTSLELRLHGAARARAAYAPDKEHQDIFDPMEACG